MWIVEEITDQSTDRPNDPKDTASYKLKWPTKGENWERGGNGSEGERKEVRKEGRKERIKQKAVAQQPGEKILSRWSNHCLSFGNASLREGSKS